MSEAEYCISLENVSKIYKLYPSVKAELLDILGFYRYRGVASPCQEFHALKNININIKRGGSLGIIGRNGAGKSTLLKLITENFAATSGQVKINGSVQALMATGLGFHPELTGMENIKNSLLYSNIPTKEIDRAYNDIIEFCELGSFIGQPVRTYSLGMISRLQFACATSIRPEILIIDEVLGAGDAYFSGKSAYRMRNLIKNNDCTLLLVSHSSQQVLQFCKEAVWIEGGEIVESGDALQVVKSYEKYIERLSRKKAKINTVATESVGEAGILADDLQESAIPVTEAQNTLLKNVLKEKGFISRWSSTVGMKIHGVEFIDRNNVSKSQFFTGEPLKIKINFYSELAMKFAFKAVIVIFTEDSVWLSRYISDVQVVDMYKGQAGSICLDMPELFLGNGSFVFSAALYKNLDLDDLGSAEAYDLLSRSFKLKVRAERRDDETIFFHPAKWATSRLFAKEKSAVELELGS
jgi:lipopolysaccharide transport system ATP-binding protein